MNISGNTVNFFSIAVIGFCLVVLAIILLLICRPKKKKCACKEGEWKSDCVPPCEPPEKCWSYENVKKCSVCKKVGDHHVCT